VLSIDLDIGNVVLKNSGDVDLQVMSVLLGGSAVSTDSMR
jgi:hypothetical protein